MALAHRRGDVAGGEIPAFQVSRAVAAAAVLHALAGRLRLLAGGAPLAAVSSLGHRLRLDCHGILFRLLFARVRLA